MTSINTGAPVVAAADLEIVAEPPLVWDVLADVERWPKWNPDVRSISLRGEIAEGAVFRWKSGPVTIVSTFLDVSRPSALAWRGRLLGISAVHVWRFDRRDGLTTVRTEESWQGVLPRLFSRRMKERLQGSLENGLLHLKAEAERRSAATRSL